jgi:hypothetical protein
MAGGIELHNVRFRTNGSVPQNAASEKERSRL